VVDEAGRTLLVQGAQHILGPFGIDCDLRRRGLKLAERGGINGRKRAIVATARKLAVSGEVYEPLHKGNRITVAAAASKLKRTTKSKSFPYAKRQKPQRRVPVTASMARATFHLEVKRQVAKQIAAPAELRTPNMYRAKRFAP
jgi:hypothetical protein